MPGDAPLASGLVGSRAAAASPPANCTTRPTCGTKEMRRGQGGQQLHSSLWFCNADRPAVRVGVERLQDLLLPARRKLLDGVEREAGPALPPARGPGGLACCYWKRYGTQCDHPAEGLIRLGRHAEPARGRT